MKKELEKVYDPSGVESRLYQLWLDKGYFHAEVDRRKKPFAIVMPPPNITGQLHMGHALDNTIQDILIRWKRMCGYSTLWLPGIDHASIATEMKVVEKMAKEGLTKEDLGRDGFMERAWAWKEEYGGIILNQLKKIGSSCDWDRLRFTMDPGLSKAVREVFCRLYEKGLIYRGEKLVNWCPHCMTTISDAEVVHEDLPGHFWHIRYPIPGTDEFMIVATTRPETMLGDTALAVHPEDERYRKYVGKTVILPLVDKEIPVVADAYVDREFGTGVVKITPAHDPNDFGVGNRHNLPKINILNDDGTINENGGRFAGMDRYEARKAIVAELEEKGYLVKVEEHTHAVGTHDRCKTVVEPMMKKQWFVKMGPLAEPAMDVYRDGRLNIVPERFGKIYMHWLENIRDWCISRQLWWGHRIPAFYCTKCGHMEVTREDIDACPVCGGPVMQDEDCLDTWFSSALWPFATLGWPDKTPELEYFYPNSVLVTGFDIIFFWVIRMVFSGLEQMGDVPFRDVLIHGLIRDDQGRKFSKSLGNGIDPLEVIAQYGADPLRLMLITGNAPGNDMRFKYDRLESCRNFANKLWNASRFVLMNLDDEPEEGRLLLLTSADKWILSKVNTLAKEVTDNMEHYELGLAVDKITNFLWDEYCDWYIEMVKPRLYNKEDPSRAAAQWTLKTVLMNALKLLHPYMPFITEELFTHLQGEEETIMLSAWPEYKEEWNFTENEKEIDVIKEAVRVLRNIRAEMNVAPGRKAAVYVVSEDAALREIFERSKVFFGTLAQASTVTVQADKTGIAANAVSGVIHNANLFMPLADLVDVEKEVARLEKEKAKTEKEIDRVVKKLANPGFTGKAPEAVIQAEREKETKYRDILRQVEERLSQLQGL